MLVQQQQCCCTSGRTSRCCLVPCTRNMVPMLVAVPPRLLVPSSLVPTTAVVPLLVLFVVCLFVLLIFPSGSEPFRRRGGLQFSSRRASGSRKSRGGRKHGQGARHGCPFPRRTLPEKSLSPVAVLPVSSAIVPSGRWVRCDLHTAVPAVFTTAAVYAVCSRRFSDLLGYVPLLAVGSVDALRLTRGWCEAFTSGGLRCNGGTRSDTLGSSTDVSKERSVARPLVGWIFGHSPV